MLEVFNSLLNWAELLLSHLGKTATIYDPSFPVPDLRGRAPDQDELVSRDATPFRPPAPPDSPVTCSSSGDKAACIA